MRRKLESLGNNHVRRVLQHRAQKLVSAGIFRPNSSNGIAASPSQSSGFSGRSTGAFAAADAEADASLSTAAAAPAVALPSPAPPLAAFLSPTRAHHPAPVNLFYDDGMLAVEV
jgi:hypothetical protein